MAKKVVATLKSGEGKEYAKCIRMERSPKNGAYQFKEAIIHTNKVKEFFEKK